MNARKRSKSQAIWVDIVGKMDEGGYVGREKGKMEKEIGKGLGEGNGKFSRGGQGLLDFGFCLTSPFSSK